MTPRTRPLALLAPLALALLAPRGAQPAAPPRPRTDSYGDPLPPGAVARLGTVRLRWSANDVALSPDGKTLASADGTDAVRLWDIATGRVRAVFRLGEGHGALTVAFSPDGKILRAGCRDGALYAWDVATGRLRLRAEGEAYDRRRVGAWVPGYVAAFSPDATRLVTTRRALGKSEVVLRDAATGKVLSRLDGGPQTLCPSLSAGGRLLATGGPDGRALFVRLRDVASGKERCRVKAWGELFNQVACSPDGRYLAAVTRTYHGRRVQAWDAGTGRELIGYRPEERGADGVARLAFSPDGKTLAVGEPAGVLRLWDLPSGKQRRRVEAHGGCFQALAFSPEGRRLATANADGTMGVWDATTGRPLHPCPGQRGAVISLAYSPGGRVLAAGGAYGTFTLWDVVAGNVLHRLHGLRGHVLCVAFSPDGKRLATGEGMRQSGAGPCAVRVWDVRSGKQVRRLGGHRNGVYALAFSSDGKRLASAGGDNLTRLWDIRSGKELRRLEGEDYASREETGNPLTLAFAPSGAVLAAASSEGNLTLWQTDTGKALARDHAERLGIWHLSFLPGRKRLLLVSYDGVVSVRDAATAKEVSRSRLPEGWRHTLALSPDGRTLAGDGDGSRDPVRLWDVATGKEILQLGGGAPGVSSLAFSPDGKVLASGGGGGDVLLWDLSRLPRARLEALWASLMHDGDADARTAVRALAEMPAEAVPFLREKVRPARPPAPPIARLIAGLGAEEFAARERATRALERLGPAAEPALRQVLEGRPSPEVRRRAERLLKALGRAKSPPPAPEQVGALRALRVLELSGTPEARKVLAELAKGAPDARLTQEAKAALRRLEGRAPAKP